MSQQAGFASLARAIVEAEVGRAEDTPVQAGRAIEETFRRLEQVVSAMVGEVGFRALMVRALHLTRQRSPKELVLPSELAACSPSEGWVSAVEQTGASAAKDCASQLIGSLLDLLASFIGEDLTFRLIKRAWQEHEGGSSSAPPGGGLQ